MEELRRRDVNESALRIAPAPSPIRMCRSFSNATLRNDQANRLRVDAIPLRRNQHDAGFRTLRIIEINISVKRIF
jgi:hypothetical protein